MSTLLAAAIIVCGALPQDNSPLVCRAQVYHGIEGRLTDCSHAALKKARSVEQSFIRVGALVHTQSHAECSYAEDDGSIIFYLTEFMAVQMGADSSRVVEYDVVEGVPVERKADHIRGARQ